MDGLSWREYEQELLTKLKALHDKVRSGCYRAKPVRRVNIPKADGSERPLGVTALEDKIVQAAVVQVLSAIYEQNFLGLSYGFRPGRGQHDALDALSVKHTVVCVPHGNHPPPLAARRRHCLPHKSIT